MNGEPAQSKVGRFFRELGIFLMIVLVLIGGSAIINAVVPKSQPDTRSAMMSTEEAMFSEGTDPEKARRLNALAIKQANAAPAAAVEEQMDSVGSVEEVEREMRKQSRAQKRNPLELVGTWNLVGALDLTLDADGVSTSMGRSGTWYVKGSDTLVIKNPAVFFDNDEATYTIEGGRLQLNYMNDGRPDVMHLRKVN